MLLMRPISALINADAIKNVTLTKGGFPARYGGRLSSILDINMKEGNMKEFHGEGSVGTIFSKLTLEGPIIKDKTSFIVSGRRTYVDALAGPLIRAGLSQGGFKADPRLFFYDLNAKINHKFSEKDRLFLSYYGGKDDFGIDLTENEADKIFLLNIQNVLFNVGSNLASDPEKEKSKMIPDVLKTDYEALENEIDEINKILEPLQYFILPGGHSSISHCHIARCVCRRAERICVALNEIEPVNEELIIYLNRLSDYLFTYARKMAKFLNVKELKWQVNK